MKQGIEEFPGAEFRPLTLDDFTCPRVLDLLNSKLYFPSRNRAGLRGVKFVGKCTCQTRLLPSEITIRSYCPSQFAIPEQPALLRRRLLLRQARDLGPALNQGVVGQRLGGAVLALGHCVQSVGQLAGGFGDAAQLPDEAGGPGFTGGLQNPHEVVDDFPDGKTAVGGRVPVLGQLLGAQQPHFPGL